MNGNTKLLIQFNYCRTRSEMVEILNDAASVDNECLASGCETRARRGAIEQLHFKLFLDLLDALADDRLNS